MNAFLIVLSATLRGLKCVISPILYAKLILSSACDSIKIFEVSDSAIKSIRLWSLIFKAVALLSSTTNLASETAYCNPV